MGRDSIGGLPDAGNGGKGLTNINIFGASYAFTDNFTGALAASDVDDYFKKYYINLNYTLPIADNQSLNFDLNGYKTKAKAVVTWLTQSVTAPGCGQQPVVPGCCL
jgi:imipenem/basic amino acid-specific outer membrane pore